MVISMGVNKVVTGNGHMRVFCGPGWLCFIFWLGDVYVNVYHYYSIIHVYFNTFFCISGIPHWVSFFKLVKTLGVGKIAVV